MWTWIWSNIYIYFSLDKESLLAISKIGNSIIDLLFYSLGKLKKTGVKSVAMNLVNNNIWFMNSIGTLISGNYIMRKVAQVYDFVSLQKFMA